MVNPSQSDASRIPPKPTPVHKHEDRSRAASHARKDFKETVRDEDERIAQRKREAIARERERRLQGSPMSLAKNVSRTPTKGRQVEKSADERKLEEDEEKLAEQEEIEGQAQAKEAKSKAGAKTEPKTPFALFQKGGVQEKGETKLAAADKKEVRKGKGNGGRLGEARSDVAALSPFGGQSGAPASVGTSVESKQQASIAEIQALVDQIVDKLYTVQKGGEMNTVVVLKQPPIFEGANLVITGFKSAGKEFNITFENLRPDAKALLDGNLQSLRTGLVEKGIVQAIHIITTTTQIEHLPKAPHQPPREQREDQQRQGRQRDDQGPEDEA